jgi:tRNA dimethylallyltransferase
VADVPPREPAVPCLVGATGTGKTDVAIALARRRRAEVVCCDAMTVYRGLSILTAKPRPPADVPHHLLDVVPLHESYSAARFAQDADALAEAIRGRGRTPLVVGGTALYLLTWVKGLGPRVPRDTALRADLARVAREEGTPALHARLRAVDPARAAEVHENDERRLVRALEIVAATGAPASGQRGEWEGPDRRAATIVLLRRSAEDLERRIRARVEAMAAAGVVDEVAAAARATPPPSPEVTQALGFADFLAVARGQASLADAIERVAIATRRFAKRQATFFRRFRDLRVVDVPEHASPDEIASLALRAYEAGTSA